MEIRKADAKGRVTVGEDGKHYWSRTEPDGTIILTPVTIPDPPKMDPKAIRAVYWNPSATSKPDQVVIHSVLGGNMVYNAEWVAKIANELKVPVVVNSTGMGGAVADILTEKVDRGVYEVYPNRRPE